MGRCGPGTSFSGSEAVANVWARRRPATEVRLSLAGHWPVRSVIPRLPDLVDISPTRAARPAQRAACGIVRPSNSPQSGWRRPSIRRSQDQMAQSVRSLMPEHADHRGRHLRALPPRGRGRRARGCLGALRVDRHPQRHARDVGNHAHAVRQRDRSVHRGDGVVRRPVEPAERRRSPQRPHRRDVDGPLRDRHAESGPPGQRSSGAGRTPLPGWCPDGTFPQARSKPPSTRLRCPRP